MPAGFRFAVKMPGHALRALDTFSERVHALGDRLGPIRIVLQGKRDDGLLELLRGSLDPALELAFDFRHESWDGTLGVVRVNDLDPALPFRYVRLREPPYGEDDLRAWAARIEPPAYVYLRHEDEPTAPAYATRLAELL